MSDEIRGACASGVAVPALLTVAVVTALGTMAIAALLVNIMERKGEAQNSFFRVVELDDETVDPAVRARTFRCNTTATCTGGSAADALRWQRSHATVPPKPTRAPSCRSRAWRRFPSEDDVGGLRVRHGFPEARPRLHARGPDVHRARAELQAAASYPYRHGSVYVPYKKAGGGDLIKGFEHYNQLPYARHARTSRIRSRASIVMPRTRWPCA